MEVKKNLKVVEKRKLFEIKSLIKIQINGNEIQNKLLSNSSECVVRILRHNLCLNDSKTKSETHIEILTGKSELIFSFKVDNNTTFIDKFKSKGLMTITLFKGKDKYNVFFSKCSQNLIEIFMEKIRKAEEEKAEFCVGNSEKNGGKNENFEAISDVSIGEMRKKMNEKYAKMRSVWNKSSNEGRMFCERKRGVNRQIQRLEKRDEGVVKLRDIIKESQKLSDAKTSPPPSLNNSPSKLQQLPNYLYFSILIFLDAQSIIWKCGLLNRYIKSISDDFVDSLVLNDDTPKEIFNRILGRFSKIKTLVLGKAKNFKNLNIKNMWNGLRQLQNLDISHLSNISKDNIYSLLSKTRGVNIRSIKLNINLEGLLVALNYVNNFYRNIEELVVTRYNYVVNDDNVSNICDNMRFYHHELFSAVHMILNTKKKMRKLSIAVYNAIPETYKISVENLTPFSNLMELNIDILFIKELKNLSCLYNCKHMEKFGLGDIVIKAKNYQNKYYFVDLDSVELEKNNETENENGIDFDNEPIEIFGKMFYHMRNLKCLKLGSFVNGDICVLIAAYFKNLHKLTIKSSKITDDCIKIIFRACKSIKYLDLRNCDCFNGNCFFELNYDDFPTELNTVLLSITNYNFYNLINFLRKKGIKAVNYLNN